MKKLATFLMIAGLFSFICLVIKQPGSLLPWFIVSYLAVASVLIFLIVQLQPVKEGEIDKRKWIIIGGICGLVGPTLLFSSIVLKLLFVCSYLILILFPFAIIGMDLTFLSPFMICLAYIVVTILNIGLYALLGLLLGTIVRGISRFVKPSQT